MTLEIFFFFAEGDVAVFSACLQLQIQKVNDYYYRLQLGPYILGPRQQVRDNNKQRHHGDGAVYFMHSMTPCIF